jgi:HPt (histidine-containing phosphotransfer) domain-containing protein
VREWETAVAQLDGNEALLQEMAALFLEECPKLMSSIWTAMAQGDMAELRRAAHTLKGSCEVFAAKPVVDAAWRMETMGRDGELTHGEEAWAALEAVVARLLPALASHSQARDASQS